MDDFKGNNTETIDGCLGANRREFAMLKLIYEGEIISKGYITNHNLESYREIISSEEINFEYYQKMKQLAFIYLDYIKVDKF